MSSDSWYSWQGNNLVIKVYIQPRASMDEISGKHGNRLKIRIQAAPVDDKANKQLLAFLASRFGISKAKLRIVNGLHSRNKTIEISGLKQNTEALSVLIQQHN